MPGTPSTPSTAGAAGTRSGDGATPASPSSAAPQGQAPTPTQASPSPVAQPWHEGTFENGIQLYWHTPGSDDAVRQAASRSLDYVVALGANSVGITFPLYTDGPTPTHVYAGQETPTPQQLRLIVAEAKARHLRVMVRPLIDEVNLMSTPGEWRGTLRPVDVDAWFRSYQDLLVAYAGASQGADEFVEGVELFSLQSYTDRWKGLTDAVAAAGFKGATSYSVNWDSHGNEGLPFSVLGLDAYPAIQLGDDATVEQLTTALTQWIDQQPVSVRAKLTIQEVGIPAVGGMYPHPWLWNGPGASNESTQAKWFTAVYRASKAAGLRGIYYWMLDSNVDPAQANPATDSSGSFTMRQAEQSIRTEFSASR